MNIRAITNEIIYRVSQDGCSLNDSFLKTLPKTLDQQATSFIKECCFGVLRWYDQLAYIASLLLNTPIKKKDADIHTLLLLGLYQILYTNVPDHAAVSETVSACKLQKKEWAAGLINKCLRRFIDEKKSILTTLQKNEHAYFSHPEWLINKIKAAWPERWETILKANNEKPPLWLRVNHQKTTSSHFLDLLHKNHIDAKACHYLPGGILLTTPQPIDTIPQFKEGYVSVQDISGQLAANLLNLKKGQRVLDACAAPGSKTSHILELQPHLSKLVIVDKAANRFPMIKENIMRLGLSRQNIQLILADTTHTKQWWDGSPFDRILLDAPCSATGVIRRHPDIKLLRQPQDIDHILQVQMQMLIALWKLLKKNGKLLYSTCSVLPEENEQIISTFLAHHDDAKIEKIKLPIGINNRYGTQILPESEGPDGFYYALISKK